MVFYSFLEMKTSSLRSLQVLPRQNIGTKRTSWGVKLQSCYYSFWRVILSEARSAKSNFWINEERIYPKARTEGSQGYTKRLGCLFCKNVTFLKITGIAVTQGDPASLRLRLCFATALRKGSTARRLSFCTYTATVSRRSAQDDPLKLCVL